LAIFARNPSFAVQRGRHEYDGRLPDWSAAAIHADGQWLHAQRVQAEMFDQNALSVTQRFERQYLLSRIDADVFWLEEAEQPFTNPAFYLDGGLDPSVYLTRSYAPAEARLKAFINYARAVPTAAAQIREPAHAVATQLRQVRRRWLRGLSGFLPQGCAEDFR
jgi:hypothetical protein